MSRAPIASSPLVFVLFLGGANVLAQTPKYTIQDLGNVNVLGINSNGQVVGCATVAFRTQPNAAPNLPADSIGTLGGSSSCATGINSSGQVVGYSTTSNGETHGFRTAPNAAINPSTDDLGSLGGPPNINGLVTRADAINDSGQVTGTSSSSSGGFGAFRTAPNNPINPSTDAISNAPPLQPEGLKINTAGDILGTNGDVGSGNPDAFVSYHDGTVATGVAQAIPGFGFTGISDQGQVVITGLDVWQNGAKTHLADCGQCVPIGLNNALQVVGLLSATSGSNQQSAFLYSNGAVYDLNGLIPSGSGWVLQAAQVINDQGQIIGFGTLNGARHAFRLDPVPVMPPGPITLVQSTSVSGSAVPSVSVGFPSATTKGNLIVAFVRMSTTSQTVSVSDSAGNTYIDAVSQGQDADGHQVHIFYAANIAGGASTVTASFSGANNHPFLAIYEYNGASALDRIAAAQGSDASPNSGATPATSSANELVFAATGLPASYTGTATAGTGFTMLRQDTGTSRAANEAEAVSATGSFAGTFSLTAAANWTAVAATFAAGTAPPPLTITTTSLPNGTQNTSYDASLTATGGTPSYTWSLVNNPLPAGLTLNSSTGHISGTPTASGTSTFVVRVTDATSQTVDKVLSITIDPSGGGGGGSIALVQSTSVDGSGLGAITVQFPSANTQGNLIIAFVRMSTTAQTVSVSDTAGNQYADAVSQTQDSDGHQVHIFYATNIVGGANTVTATFSDTNNHPFLAIYEYRGPITLDRTAAAQGYGAFPSSGATLATRSTNELVFGATGLPASYTGTASAGAGLMLERQDLGTSRAANEDQVVAATGSFTATFNLNVVANWTAVVATFAAPRNGPIITTTSLPGGLQNTPYSAGLTATGGTPPYTWSITGGALPAGLTLDPSSGTISGTPTAVGTSQFDVFVRDSNGLSPEGATTLSITITPAALTITTTSLPAGTQNTAYSATLAATGGTTPYTWSIASGALPAGLALNASSGAISGTPTATGTNNFTVQVTDSKAQTNTRQLSITINASTGGGGPITLVQSASVGSSGAPSVSLAFPAGNTKGNLIIAFVRMSTTTQTVAVSDSAGNSYSHVDGQVQDSDGSQIHIFYAPFIAGGANTITATFSGTNNHPFLAVYEYSGLSRYDTGARAQGWGTNPFVDARPITTSVDDLAFFAVGLPASYTGTVTAGSGFTLQQQDTGTSRAASETQVTPAPGIGSLSLSDNANWTAIYAVFHP